MLQKTFQVRYHLRQGQTFRQMEHLQRCLQEIAALGYHIVTLSEYEEVYRQGRDTAWSTSSHNADQEQSKQTTHPAGYLPQGISLLAQGEAMKFANDMSHHLWLSAFPLARYDPIKSFFCGLVFPAQANTCSIMITLSSISFAAKTSDALAVFESWLNLFRLMWRIWQPLYAHSYAPHTGWPEPDASEIQAAHLSSLYEVNFFGQELVQHLGQKHLSQTPSWRVQPLDQQDALLIPEFIFVPRGQANGQGELAAQHLGLQHFWRGRYLPTPAP